MPNHVTNIIEANEQVIRSMLNQDGLVDFCQIVPRHKDLELDGDMGISLAAEDAAKLMCKEKPSENELMARLQMVNQLQSSALDMDDRTFEQFVMMMRNKRNHGFYHMMDYAISAWGTKWNAYGQSVEENSSTRVSFETAWSHPAPVIEALSKKFPEHEIKVRFADEDTGSNCGYYTIKNGEMIEQNIAPMWSKMSDEEKAKWTEFAFKLRHKDADPREYGYNESWVYDEAVEDEYYASKKQVDCLVLLQS